MQMTSAADFEFRPIRIDEDRARCVDFQIDAYKISFEGYIEWLRDLKSKDCAVHLWRHDQIIGQVELSRFKDDASVGYVSLYYLVPEARGQGHGRRLDEYAMAYFRSQGVSQMRLSVTVCNLQAVRFYEKFGWKVIEEDRARSGVLVMGKSLG